MLWFYRNNDNFTLQIVLLICANLFLSCPCSRISSVDLIDETENDKKKLGTVVLISHFGRNIITAIFTLIIGFLMNSNSRYFWHALLINVFLIILIETLRKILIKKKNIN